MYYLVSYPDIFGRRRLLYVGITSLGFARNGLLKRWVNTGGHVNDKEWWDEVDVDYSRKMTTVWPPMVRGEAEELWEDREIKRLKPSKNVKGARRRPALGWPTFRPNRRANPDRVERALSTAEAAVLGVAIVSAVMLALSFFS
jgi:hypothetical protein